MSLVDRIDALLPQTQCTRCGYAGCRPYAEAIAAGDADINRCPPGGNETIAALAALTGKAARPLEPACGEHEPLAIARIEETSCIGCTLCIAACPVDAIVGAAKRMHTVLASQCTGCSLCIPPCPVDCIVLEPAGREWTMDDAAAARFRFVGRKARVARGERVANRVRESEVIARRARVAEAFARARARRRAASDER
jgi:Na+-translocating ferredoxin:NAD+ oxidoreductase subunit B